MFVLLNARVDFDSFEEGSLGVCVYLGEARKEVRLSKSANKTKLSRKRNGKLSYW